MYWTSFYLRRYTRACAQLNPHLCATGMDKMKNVSLIMASCVITVTPLSPPSQICHLWFITSHKITSIETKLVQTDNCVSTSTNFANFAAQGEKERLKKIPETTPVYAQSFQVNEFLVYSIRLHKSCHVETLLLAANL